jgi:hypothetical protein
MDKFLFCDRQTDRQTDREREMQLLIFTYPSFDVRNAIISALSINKRFALGQDIVNETVSL